MAAAFLYLLGFLAVLSAAGVVFFKNAVHSALSLTCNLMIVAVLYLSLSQQFLGVAQILIYAGAIMVVFLFAVTVLAPDEEVNLKLTDGTCAAVVLLGAIVFGVMASQIAPVTVGPNTHLPPNGVESFAMQIFGRYVFPFEGTAFVLLVALMGVVLLGHRRLRG